MIDLTQAEADILLAVVRRWLNRESHPVCIGSFISPCDTVLSKLIYG